MTALLSLRRRILRPTPVRSRANLQAGFIFGRRWFDAPHAREDDAAVVCTKQNFPGKRLQRRRFRMASSSQSLCWLAKRRSSLPIELICNGCQIVIQDKLSTQDQ
jgi:hypothetical protein